MQVKVISPEKVLMQGAAEEVEVCTAEGKMGILDRHAPLLGLLKPGLIRVKDEGQWQEIKASKGVVEVRNSVVTVLVEE